MIGRRLGAYRILQLLGSGGMGSVYLAARADDQYQKQVAIKVVPPGPESERLREYFRLERQALASLDHPNIVRLLDAGASDDGWPYLVMDYVEGVPLLDFCHTHQLPVADRLRLFLPICAAVSYAHQRMIVHRDIKPGNVLVAGGGEPKLLDFGIAKLLSSLDPAATQAMMLSPQYASPEQIRGELVTVATDVYALGVLLHEMLSGRNAYGLQEPTPMALAYAVCRTPPAATGMDADLDAILLTAMQKDPAQRYASADRLAEDVRSYLEGLPIASRRHQPLYVAGKFVRRHLLAVAASAVALGLLAAALVLVVYEAKLARQAQARAETRFQDVRELARSFLFDFHDAIQDLPGSTPARLLVTQKATEYLDRLSRDAAQDVSLQLELSEAYRRVGTLQGNPYSPNLGDPSGAVASYRKALVLAERAAQEKPGDTAAQRQVAQGYQALSDVLPLTGNPSEGLRLLRQALSQFQVLARERPNDSTASMDLAAALESLGDVLSHPDRTTHPDPKEAAERYRQSLEIWKQLRAAEPVNVRARRAVPGLLMKVGDVASSSGENAAAKADYEEALAKLDGPASRLRTMLLGKLAMTLSEMGNHAGAAQHFQQAVKTAEDALQADPANGQAQFDVIVQCKNAADRAYEDDDQSTAIRYYGRAVELLDAMTKHDPDNVQARHRFAELLMLAGSAIAKSGQAAEAQRQAARGLALTKEMADQSEATPAVVHQYASYLLTMDPASLRNPAAALPYALRAVAATQEANPIYLDTLARAYYETGQKPLAIETVRKGLRLLADQNGEVRQILQAHLDKYLQGGGGSETPQ